MNSNWTITIQGNGPVAGGKRPDLDTLAERFVRQLKEGGHEVDQVHIRTDFVFRLVEPAEPLP